MKLLYETLLKNPGPNVELNKVLNEAEIINADNVAEYLFEISDQEEWDVVEDYPNAAPPFERFFIEFRVTEKINSNGAISDNPYWRHGIRRVGILFSSVDYKNLPERLQENEGAKFWAAMSMFEARWMIIAHLFLGGIGGTARELPIFYTFMVRENGAIHPMGGHPYQVLYTKELDIAAAEDFSKAFTVFVGPALLAISFMHCKNVTLIPKGAGTYPGKRKRHAPTIRYHVLEIEPMKKVLRTEGNSEETGLKKALHICRGHFKDYRNSKGLFGKYQDVFWWDSHVRGDVSEGIVVKDYSVNPKRDDRPD